MEHYLKFHYEKDAGPKACVYVCILGLWHIWLGPTQRRVMDTQYANE
jgi:hypothetical protein